MPLPCDLLLEHYECPSEYRGIKETRNNTAALSCRCFCAVVGTAREPNTTGVLSVRLMVLSKKKRKVGTVLHNGLRKKERLRGVWV